MTRRSLLQAPVLLALRQDRLDQAVRLLERHTASGFVSAAVLHVRDGGSVTSRAFGAARTPEAVFLLASISKPMTCAGVMRLVDRGELSLADPVQRVLPEFRGGERGKVTLRHLLTHTSGLPDMLPENVALRKRHAPLPEFVSAACRTPLLFSPGSEVRYQSMGILLAAEMAQRVTKRPFPEFLRTEVFLPLGMRRTSLGLGNRPIAGTMRSQVPEESDWDWNSPYWRNLASPWGGAHADAADVARFLDSFARPDGTVLKPTTAASMVTNQNAGLSRPYGLGWAVEGSRFGKGCSPSTFGHGGSTGTLCWLDPARNRSFVLLTTKPAEQSQKPVLTPVSDWVSEA